LLLLILLQDELRLPGCSSAKRGLYRLCLVREEEEFFNHYKRDTHIPCQMSQNSYFAYMEISNSKNNLEPKIARIFCEGPRQGRRRRRGPDRTARGQTSVEQK